MIKNDIALAIEKKSEFNRAKSLLIVETILDSLKTALAGNEKVEIRGFGSFKVVAKKTGYGRDIRRQETDPDREGQADQVPLRPGIEEPLSQKPRSPDDEKPRPFRPEPASSPPSAQTVFSALKAEPGLRPEVRPAPRTVGIGPKPCRFVPRIPCGRRFPRVLRSREKGQVEGKGHPSSLAGRTSSRWGLRPSSST